MIDVVIAIKLKLSIILMMRFLFLNTKIKCIKPKTKLVMVPAKVAKSVNSGLAFKSIKFKATISVKKLNRKVSGIAVQTRNDMHDISNAKETNAWTELVFLKIKTQNKKHPKVPKISL